MRTGPDCDYDNSNLCVVILSYLSAEIKSVGFIRVFVLDLTGSNETINLNIYVKISLHNFYCHHHKLVDRYEISPFQMVMGLSIFT